MTVSFRLLHTAPGSTAPVRLDDQQERVATHRGGPLLVLAGPGTGKTTTLVETVARRVEGGAAPESLLLLTFSRRAAAELRQRLALRLAGRHVAPTAWTFHSFCLALLAEERARLAPGSPRPQLLTGPEQDSVIRELLRGDLADGRPWPAPLDAVLDTRGLTEEVRALVARAQLLGLTPADLADASNTRDDWRAVAAFYEQYQQSLEAQGLLDYTELVARAAAVAGEPDVRERLRARYSAVWVDEYQDTDPLQESLLLAIAGDGRDVTVVGDPDQAIYAFRGADVRGILDFPSRFGQGVPGRPPAPVPVVALTTSRRSGAALVEAARRVAAKLPVPQGFAHRHLVPSEQPGEVGVATLPTEGAEAEWIADRLRREHLDNAVPWSSMAVLVRSGASVPLLRRALGSMGVPVEVAADELPLSAEPAVAPLLLALRCADDPAQLTDEWVRELLLSPLIGADPAELRRVGRGLRQAERLAHPQELPSAAQTLIRRAVAEPALLDVLPPGEGSGVRRLAAALADAGRLLRAGGTPADALWSLWSESRWRRRLAAVAGRGDTEARAADRDLDAVLALFDTVARTQEQRVGIKVSALLETLAAQQIPAGTQEERPVPRDGVRLLTAHRSKGLEWEVVVVAGVQETSWPDLRPRGSLLNPDELRPGGAQSPPDTREALADERRLFYVACTRASRLLLVTAVSSVAEDGERPSRFLAELGVPVWEQASRPTRPRTLSGLVAALRCEAVDPQRSPEVRAAAARRLAVLASARDGDGRPLASAADPTRWWGMLPRSEGERYDPAQPTPLSASTLNKLEDCPLAWFLAHEARSETPATVAVGFGKVVHALADLVSRSVLPPDEEVLLAELDRVWGALGYEVPWQQANEREQARRAIRRLLAHLVSERGREFVASEVSFDVNVPTDAGPVTLRGRVDRVEGDADGRYVVVDYKTGRSKLAPKKVPEDRQLALYQYVVASGSMPGLPDRAEPGGAELWQLRDGDEAGATVQAQAPPEGGFGPLVEELGAARSRVLAGEFPATPGEVCKRCTFRGACPGSDEGCGVVT